MKNKQKENRIIGTYIYPSFANKNKIYKIKAVLLEYRKTAAAIAKLQWKNFYTKGQFDKNMNIKSLQSRLTERYKQTCQWQVVSILEGFISNIQQEFAKIVFSSNLPEKTKRILLFLNSRKEWLIKKNKKAVWYENNEKTEYEITQEERLLSKKIFKHILSKWNKPRFRNISMMLDSKVAIAEENRKSKTFDKWIKISTLERNKPVFIPLKNNTYAEAVDGEFLNFYQIEVKENKLTVRLIKELKKKEYEPMIPEIAIDLGLDPLFATDKGDLIGKQFLTFLTKMDEKITRRMAYLQKNGIKPSQDTMYNKMVKNLREFLKNEINRFLNHIVELYRPARIVVEKLDFRSPELSKRLNRLIQQFGKRYITEKLKRLNELYGIEIVEVNPAYTSQQCSKCGYVDKDNRKSTHEFECKACRYKINAQINGARNILNRRSIEDIKIHTPKKQVLKILIEQYLERHKGCNSAPLEVLSSNPYFSEFLDTLPIPLECDKCL
ncbi:MAG TPA: IS200/IS605 family element transposase accessory protein TnpB [Thermoanaerobacter sp.]|nr:IS200/IS605 family element transposase accessory protein TnpB [Thermoanaerobacter sp.]